VIRANPHVLVQLHVSLRPTSWRLTFYREVCRRFQNMLHSSYDEVLHCGLNFSECDVINCNKK
jgi:hypothetical protein